MKKTKHTGEQIAVVLKQAETGTSVAEVIRRMGGAAQGLDDAQHRWKGCGGVSEQMFYRWKKVYGGLDVGELHA